jgi:hypothetical protein
VKELEESFSSQDELPEDVLSHETELKDFPFEEGLAIQTPLGELPFRDSSLQEMLPQDFCFEYGSLEETPLQDLSSADDSVGEKLPKDLPPKDDEDTLSEGLPSGEEEDDADAPRIGHDIVNAFRAAMQWCDDVANEPNDIFTNLKSQLPFLIVVAGMILLLWIARFIYG